MGLEALLVNRFAFAYRYCTTMFVKNLKGFSLFLIGSAQWYLR
jgi:hypothetical protein